MSYKTNFDRLNHTNLRLNFSLASAKDRKFAGMIREKLKVFYDVSLLISRINFPIANLLFRLICEIKLNLQSLLAFDVESIVI